MSTIKLKFKEREYNTVLFETRGPHPYNVNHVWWCTSATFTPPPVREHRLEIPGRNGSLDFTEILGLSYGDKVVKLTLESDSDGSKARGQLARIHGREIELTSDLPQDEALFPKILFDNNYKPASILGRASVSEIKRDGATITATVTIVAEPFCRQNFGYEIYQFVDDAGAVERVINWREGPVDQYPAFEIQGQPMNIFNTLSPNVEYVTLPVGTYESGHPFLKFNAWDTTHNIRFGLASGTGSGTLILRPILFGEY